MMLLYQKGWLILQCSALDCLSLALRPSICVQVSRQFDKWGGLLSTLQQIYCCLQKKMKLLALPLFLLWVLTVCCAICFCSTEKVWQACVMCLNYEVLFYYNMGFMVRNNLGFFWPCLSLLSASSYRCITFQVFLPILFLLCFFLE